MFLSVHLISTVQKTKGDVVSCSAGLVLNSWIAYLIHWLQCCGLWSHMFFVVVLEWVFIWTFGSKKSSSVLSGSNVPWEMEYDSLAGVGDQLACGSVCRTSTSFEWTWLHLTWVLLWVLDWRWSLSNSPVWRHLHFVWWLLLHPVLIEYMIFIAVVAVDPWRFFIVYQISFMYFAFV